MRRTWGVRLRTVLLTLVLLWGALFVTDYVRCDRLKAPLFVIAAQTADDGGSGTYYGLGYTVEIQMHLSAETGRQLDAVQMKVLGRVISASAASAAA